MMGFGGMRCKEALDMGCKDGYAEKVKYWNEV